MNEENPWLRVPAEHSNGHMAHPDVAQEPVPGHGAVSATSFDGVSLLESLLELVLSAKFAIAAAAAGLVSLRAERTALPGGKSFHVSPWGVGP